LNEEVVIMSYEYRKGLNKDKDSAAGALRWRDELVEDIQKLRESGDSSPQALELLYKLEQLRVSRC
jgi:hypothetical protein